jgi:hypothetical protein
MWFLALILLFAGLAIVMWGADIINWHRSLPADAVNELAAWASIYGFLVAFAALLASGYAAWGVKQIRSRFLAKARLPNLVKKLEKDASLLLQLAGAVPIPQERKTTLFSSLKANLEAIRRHLPRNIKRTQKSAKKKFEMLSQQANAADAAQSLDQLPAFWPTYEQIQLLTNEAGHHLADEKWES